MLKSLKEKINTYRLELKSSKRKKQLSKEIEEHKILHLKPNIKSNFVWYGNSYGGFYVNPDFLNNNSIVYSFGIGKDIGFDLGVINNHGCTVFGFDPTPKSINWIKGKKIDPRFNFNEFGISTKSGTETFFLPAHPKGVSGSLVDTTDVDKENSINVSMKSFDDICQELGHTHIDVLKMDIEGSEYEVLENILSSDLTVDQFLIEFHDRLFDQNEYKSKRTVEQMKEKGYEVFAASISYEEISFIRKELVN